MHDNHAVYEATVGKCILELIPALVTDPVAWISSRILFYVACVTQLKTWCDPGIHLDQGHSGTVTAASHCAVLWHTCTRQDVPRALVCRPTATANQESSAAATAAAAAAATAAALSR